MIPFKYEYRRWWHRFSPTKRRLIREANKMAEYWWNNGGEARIKNGLLGTATMGVGYIKIDWERR